MSYLTERKLANTMDTPVNLPTTQLKMGDWLVIATLRLTAPMRITYRFMNFNFLISSFDLTKIQSVNLVVPTFGFCYVGLYANYVSGDPSGLTALDIVQANQLGLVTRTGNPVVMTDNGTYSWVAVNNVQFSSQNALLGPNDSADFTLAATGQARVELDLAA